MRTKYPHKPLTDPFEDHSQSRWWHRGAYVICATVTGIAVIQIIAELFFT